MPLGAKRVADEGDIVQVKVVNDVSQVIGQGVDVIAGSGRSDRP